MEKRNENKIYFNQFNVNKICINLGRWLRLCILVVAFFSANIIQAQELKKVKLALNWKAEPEFGGFYEAQITGVYKKNGFDVELLEGGSGTPTLQMLTQKTVDMAIVSSEEIILHNAKEGSSKIVALFTAFEKAPYILMTHKGRYKNIKEIFADDKLQISLQRGLPFVDFLLAQYKPVKAQVVPYAGGITLFTKNKNLAQQGFYFAEPLQAQKAKVDVDVWFVADVGFNPYLVTLAVRSDDYEKNKMSYDQFVKATRQGWLNYLKKPDHTNEFMNKLNPSMTLDVMKDSLPLVNQLAHFPSGILFGQMQASRFDELQNKMLQLGLIKKTISADSYFRQH